MLFAKVNEDYRWHNVTACGGMQLTPHVFLQVPAHEEESARALAADGILDVTDKAAEAEKFNAASAPVAAAPAPSGDGDVDVSAAAQKLMDEAGLSVADVPDRNQKGNIGKPEVQAAIDAAAE